MKKICPKIEINNSLVNNLNDILKNRQSMELYESFKDKRLLLWLQQKGYMNSKSFGDYFYNSNDKILEFYRLLSETENFSVDIDLKMDFKNFKSIIEKIEKVSDLDQLFNLTLEYFQYEVFSIEQEGIDSNSLLSNNMDFHLMSLIVLVFHKENFSKIFMREIRTIFSRTLPMDKEATIFNVKKEKHFRGSTIEIDTPIIVTDYRDVIIRSVKDSQNIEDHRVSNRFKILSDVEIDFRNYNAFIEYVEVPPYE